MHRKVSHRGTTKAIFADMKKFDFWNFFHNSALASDKQGSILEISFGCTFAICKKNSTRDKCKFINS
jgi:hypothetical protein